uniref:Uncharacterized protein n=1 Tax=Anguilla anguilla TaxID=7936 RepID=A0A0E9THK0_ANGAN
MSKYIVQVVVRAGCPLSLTDTTMLCFMVSDSAMSR